MNRKEIILSSILVIFYLVGIVGTHISIYKPTFLGLSSVNLLLSFVILFLSRVHKSIFFIRFIVFAFIVGMLAEWIGVHTSLLFGSYSYGRNLGFKLLDVPLIIGLNWVMLTVVTSSMVNRMSIVVNAKVFLSALLMTLFDVLMEPVAIRSDFWIWNNGTIPFYNYVCWFFISLGLQKVYFHYKLVESNKVHDLLFFSLIIFFTSLILF